MKSGKYENNEYYRMQNLPYEKFISYGSRSLTDSELLAIMLRTGTRGMNARALGERVLSETARYGNGLLGLYHIPLQELCKIDGIGKVKAIQLKTVAELSTRMAQAKAKHKLSFHSPASIADYYMERFRHESVEHIMLLLLDSGLHLTRADSLQGNRERFFSISEGDIHPRTAGAGCGYHASAQSSGRESGAE